MINSLLNDIDPPLFIDLIDDYNQRTLHGGNRPDDRVNGYTFSHLESLLNGVGNLEQLKEMLKMNKPEGVSNEDIDELINFYINL